jgi:putative transposase
VERLATLSTGEIIANPRFGAAAARGIGSQRKLARAKRGSRRRLKAVAHLARQRRKLANRRKTHLHQFTAAITARFGGIAVEDLKVKTLTTSAKGTVERPGKNVRQKAGLNREILDTSPGMMISMLRYKAERASGRFAVVNARNTSQECSQCGRTVPKDLSVRIHRCAHCKMEVHRDVNAARNVLKRAVAGPWSGFCARKQRPDCRPSLRKPQARSSLPNSGKDFELRHYMRTLATSDSRPCALVTLAPLAGGPPEPWSQGSLLRRARQQR